MSARHRRCKYRLTRVHWPNIAKGSLSFCTANIFDFIVTFSPSPVSGQENELPENIPHFELEELVVTGTRFGAEVRRLPRHVTVITREDIEQAPGNNLGDLLAREGDVTLRSSFGHDKVSAVDIRGMGEASVSNVLVLVDGVRLNPPDLAGPDLSSIPIDQVERIEILRGPVPSCTETAPWAGYQHHYRKGGEGFEVQAHSSAGELRIL